MKKAIILHGYQDKNEYYDEKSPAGSNGHWKPWLQKQLLNKDINAQTPQVFMSWQLKYDEWAKEVENYGIDENTMLIGHSCGGGFFVRWLSEHPEANVDKVVLVAPWVNPLDDPKTDFFDFDINPKIAEQTKGITIFASDNDFETVQKSIEIIREKVENVDYREFHDYGHFCLDDMGTEEFPELLKHLLKS